LTAIQAMRGLGSLSDAEGAAATRAVARMDTSTSRKAFDEALSDYEKIVKQGHNKAAKRLGLPDYGGDRPAVGGPVPIRPVDQGPQPAPHASQRFRFNPATGELE
jgi:hypothetical protein